MKIKVSDICQLLFDAATYDANQVEIEDALKKGVTNKKFKYKEAEEFDLPDDFTQVLQEKAKKLLKYQDNEFDLDRMLTFYYGDLRKQIDELQKRFDKLKGAIKRIAQNNADVASAIASELMDYL